MSTRWGEVMKVLVVDDDVVSRMVLMHLIDSCGSFEILEAEDGEDAWQQLERGLRPAICFCDLRMPRLSGMDLLQRVKADRAFGAMPFVLVSSAADRATVDQATGLGADGYIVKPFQPEQVREHMAAFADQAAAGRHLAEAPLATMQRLGINGDRLLVYLGGFQSQLAGASLEVDTLLAGGQQDLARARIERLHAGCVTLGLSGAADTLKALASGPLDAAAMQPALADAVRAVMHQSEAVKRMHGAG
jgi:two-component system chemotaxis response regulator CheY